MHAARYCENAIRGGWQVATWDPLRDRWMPKLAGSCLGAELVGLPILIDLLTRLGVLPPAEPVLHAVIRRGCFGEVRRDPPQTVPAAPLDVLHLRDRLQPPESEAGPVA